MSVTVRYEPVNSDQPGWTKKNLIDSLETVFANLGYHSDLGIAGDAAMNGVPSFVYGPNYSSSAGANYYDHMGGSWTVPYEQITSSSDKLTTPRYRIFQPVEDGDDAYHPLEYWCVSSVDTATDEITLNGGYGSDTSFNAYNDVLQDDYPVVWRPGETGTDYTNLVCGNTYYVIRVSTNKIKLAETAGGAAIDLDGALGAGSLGYATSGGTIIRDVQSGSSNGTGTYNKTITVKQGDYVIFDFPGNNSGLFKIWNAYKSHIDGNGRSPYAAARDMGNSNNVNNFNYGNHDLGHSYDTCPHSVNATSGTFPSTSWVDNNNTTHCRWNPRYWTQTTTTEPHSFFRPSWEVDDYHQGSYNYGINPYGQIPIQRYYYGNFFSGTNGHAKANMFGEIVVEPNYNYYNTGQLYSFWDVTIAGDGAGVTGGGGAGKDLVLRVFRVSSGQYAGMINHIQIVNMTDGWSDEAVFTIPGNLIGQATPANDIVFGVNADETSNDARDGTPTLITTNFGGKNGFFQKSHAGTFAVLARDNTAVAKKRSRTYWGFSWPYESSSWEHESHLFIDSGIYYDVKNRPGIKYDNKDGTVVDNLTSSYNRGIFTGVMGEDYQYDNNSLMRLGNSSGYGGTYDGIAKRATIQVAKSSAPHDNPIRIYYYQGDTGQDTSFAIISFVQFDNNVPVVYDSLILHGGELFMSTQPGVDLDELYHGSFTKIKAYGGGDRGTEEYLKFSSWIPGRGRDEVSPTVELDGNRNTDSYVLKSSKRRDSMYGYLRNGSSPDHSGRYVEETHISNILTYSGATSDYIKHYYRDEDNDSIDTSGWTNPNAGNITTIAGDWYKPIKGIPINSKLAPCPYYLPDDFVLIQFNISPGNAQIRQGDTITIGTSPSNEDYTVAIPSFENNTYGWDQVANRCAGIALCVRTN